MPALTSHKLLSFDVYGTLIDWESGIHTAFLPTLHASKSSPSHPAHTKSTILTTFHSIEKDLQAHSPDLPYSQLLTKAHPLLAQKIGLDPPTEPTSLAFGNSIGTWPAFPDTISALQRLQKHFKLIVLSNTDRASFSATNSTQLPGIEFDAVLTAQDIGSYKPDRRNFEYMLDYVHSKWGITKEEVLQTAQSQFHDHFPAKETGIRSVWIVRPGAIMGEVGKKGEEVWDWKFDTLGGMADAVEKELEEEL
ncbi:MAG: hypothetical protein Q9166_007111 [cf. Caloplaca sp. 2 TL-2023]